MGKIFKELVGDRIMMAIDELERSIFPKNKDQHTGADSNDDR